MRLATVVPDQGIESVHDVEIEELGVVLVRLDNGGLDVLEHVEVLFLDIHGTSRSAVVRLTHGPANRARHGAEKGL